MTKFDIETIIITISLFAIPALSGYLVHCALFN
jgi:hypothetical protein